MPISAEAAGQVRLALASMQREHEAFLACVRAVPMSLVSDLAFKTRAGRNRAAASIQGILPGKPTIELNRTLVYRLLRPREQPLTDPAMVRDGVEVAAMCCGLSRGFATLRDAPWSFYATFHALGRLWERARPRVDIRAAVIDAHEALLNSPVGMFNTAHDEASWAIPVQGGAFLADIKVVPDQTRDALIFVRATTWVSLDMLAANQRAQIQACLFPTIGPKLKHGLLLPQQLRSFVEAVAGIVQLPINHPLSFRNVTQKARLHAHD